MHESRDGVDFGDFKKPKDYLRRYLRGITRKLSGLSHFVLLTNEFPDLQYIYETEENIIISRGLPGRLGFDLMRGVDTFAFNLDNHLITYTQLPGFIFATVLKPKVYRGYIGHEISLEGGVLKASPDKLITSDMYPFILSRSKRLDSIKMSDEQAKKVEDIALKSPKRWKQSETSRLAHLLKNPTID